MFVLHVTPDECGALARPTTERLQVLLRPVTTRHILLRSPRFTTAYYAYHKHRDCRGRFFDSIKICPGTHGNHGLSRLLIPSSHVLSRPSRFGHGGLKRDCRGCRDPSVNVAFIYSAVKLFSKYSKLQGRIHGFEFGGRSSAEAPALELRRRRRRMGVGYGEGVFPPHWERGQCPLLRKFFLILGSQNAYFGAFSAHLNLIL